MKDHNQQPLSVVWVQRRWLRPFHEFVFSLNVAFGIMFGRIFGYDAIFVPAFRLEQMVYRQWGVTGAGGATSAYLALSFCVMLLTALPFFLFRCFRRTHLIEHVLVSVAGFLALGLAPAIWFYVNGRYGWSWYPAEVAIYLLLALLYLLQKWTIPVLVAILIAGFHYGFWYFRFWEFERNPLGPMVPIIGFCACSVWVIYVPMAKGHVRLPTPSVD